jgi:methionyl-tRNA synthetase
MILPDISAQLNNLPTSTLIMVGILFVWTLVWKGIALWKSARLGHKVWFIVFILPINTAGILEILYVYVFSRLSFNHLAAKPAPVKKRRK